MVRQIIKGVSKEQLLKMLGSLDWFPMYYPNGLAKNTYGALLDAQFIDIFEPLVQYLSERKKRVIGDGTYWIEPCYSEKYGLTGWRLFCKKHHNLIVEAV